MSTIYATKLPEDPADPYSLVVTEMAVAFGRAVRFSRMRRGWEQRDLAKRAGVNSSYLSGIERGVRNPTLDVVVRLARALEMTASDLVRAAENEARPDAGATTSTSSSK